MNPYWILLGRLTFWLTWPFTWLYLRGSKRTRVLVSCGDYLIVTKGWLSRGKWTLPGGGLHKGEDSLTGVLRELYEETGLRLQPGQLKRHSEHVFQYKRQRFNYVLFVAAVRRRERLRRQLLEIVETKWIDHRELSHTNAEHDVLDALSARW